MFLITENTSNDMSHKEWIAVAMDALTSSHCCKKIIMTRFDCKFKSINIAEEQKMC